MPFRPSRRAVLSGLPCALLATPAAAQAPFRPSPEALEAAAAYSAARRGVSLLVLADGRTLFESYDGQGAVDRPNPLASGTKSFCGVLAAAAVQDKRLRLDEAAADTFPEWRADPAKRRITVRHLLTLTSGLETRRTRGDVLTGAEALNLPLVAEPGARFVYGGDPFQVFAELMRRKLSSEDPLAYLRRRVLDPADVQTGPWGRREDGLPHLAGGARLTARDWARFGEFVRLGGRVNGRALVDEQTLAANFEGTAANPAYGLSWWLNRRVDPTLRRSIPQLNAATDVRPEEPAFPRDLVLAAGAGKQRLYISRELGLVVVRQAGGIRQAQRAREPDGFSDAAFWRLLRS